MCRDENKCHQLKGLQVTRMSAWLMQICAVRACDASVYPERAEAELPSCAEWREPGQEIGGGEGGSGSGCLQMSAVGFILISSALNRSPCAF